MKHGFMASYPLTRKDTFQQIRYLTFCVAFDVIVWFYIPTAYMMLTQKGRDYEAHKKVS